MTVTSPAKIIEAAAVFVPPEKEPPPVVVTGFRLRPHGLFYCDADPDKEDLHLSGPFEVVAETRDATGGSWGVLLRWKDHDGREHEWAMPRALLAGDGTDYRRVLLDGGLSVAPGRRARELLTSYLAGVRVTARATCVDRTGWHGRVYVSPGRSFGDTEGERVLLQAAGTASDTKPRGTLDGWRKEVAALAVGNTRLAFALSAAFAGPLLYLLNAESGGVHFRGPSSIGKSCALHVAASAWGCPVHNWRATDNAAEALARGANDALLCLDELGQADGRAADAMGYMLSNGTGKARMNKDTSARPVTTWRVLFLSTGEIGLAEKAAEAGRKTKAGQEVRVLDIPADAGAGLGTFEALHGSVDGDAFARRVRLATETHRGHAADAFLEAITAADLDELAGAVRAGCERWKAAHLPAGADGQVQRAAGRFALIAAAGELAATMGVLPWPEGEAIKSAAVCFDAWIGARGGKGPAEVAHGKAQVRAFLEAHGLSRFEPAWERDGSGNHLDLRIANRVGFRRRDSDGNWEYFALPEGFKEMCQGFNSKTLAAAMIDAGMLLPAAGKSQKPVRVPGNGTMKLYHFPAAALSDGGDDA
ncbi:putative DNA primase/helicase [Azospirillum brasilense]|uniref:Putative DNA primase/helicase n=1 Tax=Azospirillum brasilense TaxID=192 RepID=A0A560BMA8_AZOBR|nr:putative DNA primase/helicase [Azospirillum brasilense]